ncbi:phosphoribosylanthranilate isomerase [Parasphingopyxis marina]|uniref:N-(5'-phosphoribosyl)anthranilate isomerase n=1 Tax=Parasphingopyxis marina TaxID=2761622 RepID=A0A842HZZ9_9SPHN|nr:phosphoribosylanthranilate isomerase [Parasphingopyxis marina]MBC2777959.1 phosphoribosylanthranilate isomerase [Parasphingopyxis marina]
MADIDVKICGLTTAEAIEAAADGGASHAGFVFFEASPRNIRPLDAAALTKHVPESMQRVGVFVDPEDSLLERAITAARLDIVQFHGDEKPERLKAIKGRHKIAIWKAIPVSTASDLEKARRYEGIADLILFDARTPKASRLPGGMGIAFDWKLLERIKHKMPWGLSGGLSAVNVAEAIAVTGTPLIDVSSGVESAPGIKDPKKIAQFMEAVKAT